MNKGVLCFALFVALIISLNQSGLVTKDALLERLKTNKNWLRSEAGFFGYIAVVIDLV
jgi:hypothetical protein